MSVNSCMVQPSCMHVTTVQNKPVISGQVHLVGTLATELACMSISAVFSEVNAASGRSMELNSLGEKKHANSLYKIYINTGCFAEQVAHQHGSAVCTAPTSPVRHACMQQFIYMKHSALMVDAESIFLPRMCRKVGSIW